jgi:hypothetical protein
MRVPLKVLFKLLLSVQAAVVFVLALVVVLCCHQVFHDQVVPSTAHQGPSPAACAFCVVFISAHSPAT